MARVTVGGMSDGMIVRVETVDGIATITLDSQHNRNALSSTLLGQLNAALEALEEPALGGDVRAIVLTHEGPAFCAGADLKERAAMPAGQTTDSTPMVAAMTRLMDIPVPTIAAVKGAVRAGGIGLMGSCDLVVVGPDISFALTEVRIGVVAALISVPIFRRCSPSAMAAPLLTGETFDAATAKAAGLITHVGDVDAIVAELTAGVRLGAPAAVSASKELLRRAYDTSPADRDAEFRRMQTLSERFFAGDDAAEGMTAFAERRQPRWQR